MPTPVNVTAIQAALASAGFLRALTPPFSGKWDATTRAGYAEYVRRNNGNEYDQMQPPNLESIPGPLRAAIVADADGDGQTDPTASPAADRALTQGTPVSNVTISTITGGVPSAVSAVGFPAGVTANFSGQAIRINGTPTALGTFNGSVDVTTDKGHVTVLVKFVVSAAPASATPNPVTGLTAVQGTPYTQNITTVANGVPSSVSVTAGALPAGLSLAVVGQAIRLAGTPGAAGAISFTATVVTPNGNVVVPVSGTVAAA